MGDYLKASNRIGRINEEIQRELSSIIEIDLKDPRLETMITVLRVDTTQDLKYCKIYISILGNDEQKQAAMEGIKDATGFIRRELAHRINLRNTPELLFNLDNSTEYAIKMSKLIDEVTKKE